MSRTFIRPETQIKTLDVFDDQVAAGSALETTTWNLEQFLQGCISQLNRFLNTTVSGNDWYADLTAPVTFEGGAVRGIDDTNQDLHDLERKRILRSVANLTDIGPLGSVQVQILTLGQLPVATTAAIGAVTTLGTVCATATTFGTASATDIVSGTSAISPKNMVELVDATTRDPLVDSGGKRIWGLFQCESSTDGSTLTGTTPDRAQLSFVVINATGDGLQLVAAADMNGKTINYASVERVGLTDLNEQDFLRGAIVDVPGGTTVTRQIAYDNQGVTPVDVTTHSYLDLEGAGLVWQIRDDLEAILFSVVEGSAGGTSVVQIAADVDTFDVNAAVNDFLQGVTVDSGGTAIDIGVTTAGAITSAAGLALTSSAASDLDLIAAALLTFTDQYQAGSGYATDLVLSDSSAEWDAYETAFGEVSLLNAIVQASQSDNRQRAVAYCTSNITANTLIEGPSGPGAANISVDLLDYRNVSFVDDVEIFINGQLMWNGADAAANNDVYPSATATPDQQYGCFYAEFNLKASPGNPDVIQMFITGA